MSPPIPPARRTPLCVKCRKLPVDAGYRPFCSKHCANADLGDWMTGNYVIAGQPAGEADGNSGAAAAEDESEAS